MGCICSLNSSTVYSSTYLNSYADSGNVSNNAENEDALPRFQVLRSHHEAIIQFMEDESVPPQSLGNARMIELRTLLGDKISYDILFNYAKKLKRAEGAKKKLQLNVFACWFDIWQLRKAAAEAPQSFQKAKEIYVRYVRKKSLTIIDELLGNCGEYFEMPESKRVAHKNPPHEYLLPIFYFCFLHIFECVFQKFVHSHEYTDMNKYLRDNINSVDVSDFKFLSILGEGSCGLVFESVKRSTNVRYALKILQKKKLIRQYTRKPYRVDEEVRTLVALRDHPYIVNLAYAFTTSSAVMLSLELCDGIELKKVLSVLPEHRLPDAHCRFYTAEIVSAISYMHLMGFIYRDLKPGNIMICLDGHIKLVDMGSCVDLERDESGQVISKNVTKEQPLTNFCSPFHCPLLANMSSQPSQVALLSEITEKSSYAGACIGADGLVVGVSDGSGAIVGPTTPMSAAIAGGNGSSALGSITRTNDLRAAKSRYVRARTIAGTLGYLAPELMQQHGMQLELREGYGHSADWWSLGACLYRMYTGQYPYAIETNMLPVSLMSQLAQSKGSVSVNRDGGGIQSAVGTGSEANYLGLCVPDIGSGMPKTLDSNEYTLVNEEEWQPTVYAGVMSTVSPVDFLSIGNTYYTANSQQGSCPPEDFAIIETFQSSSNNVGNAAMGRSVIGGSSGSISNVLLKKDVVMVSVMSYGHGYGSTRETTLPTVNIGSVNIGSKEEEEVTTEGTDTRMPPDFPTELFTPDAADFILKCLEFDPEKRWARQRGQQQQQGVNTSGAGGNDNAFVDWMIAAAQKHPHLSGSNSTMHPIQEIMSHQYFDAVPEFNWSAVHSKALSPPSLPVDVESLRAELVEKTASLVQSTKVADVKPQNPVLLPLSISTPAAAAVHRQSIPPSALQTPTVQVSSTSNADAGDMAAAAAAGGGGGVSPAAAAGFQFSSINQKHQQQPLAGTTSCTTKTLAAAAASSNFMTFGNSGMSSMCTSSHSAGAGAGGGGFDRMMVNLGRKDWLISDLNLGAVPLDTGNFNPTYKIPKITNLNEFMFVAWRYVNPAVIRLEQVTYCPKLSIVGRGAEEGAGLSDPSVTIHRGGTTPVLPEPVDHAVYY